jgi:hypothetical protein
VYRRYCKEDIDVGIEASTRWRRLRQRERIRAYRRYCKDIEDIETNTKVETAERHGGDGLFRVYRRYCKEDIENIETNTKRRRLRRKRGRKRSGTRMETRIVRLRKELICEFEG